MATKTQWIIDINYLADPERSPSEVRRIIWNTLGVRPKMTPGRVVVDTIEDAMLARLNLDRNIVAVTAC